MSAATASVTLPSSILRDLLAGALVTASKDVTLPVLTCVRLRWDEATPVLTADATDRYRIVEGRAEGVIVEGSATVHIQRSDVDALLKLLPKAPARGGSPDAVITATGLQVTFEAAGSTRTVLATDADFPRIERLWPSGDDEPTPVTQADYTPALLAGLAKVPLAKDAVWRCTFRLSKPTLIDAEGVGIAWRMLIQPAGPGAQR